MKQLSCKDMGAAECDFVATGNTAEELKDKMMEHAKMEHSDMLDSMSDDEKSGMMKKMDAMMKDV